MGVVKPFLVEAPVETGNGALVSLTKPMVAMEFSWRDRASEKEDERLRRLCSRVRPDACARTRCRKIVCDKSVPAHENCALLLRSSGKCQSRIWALIADHETVLKLRCRRPAQVVGPYGEPALSCARIR